MKPVHRARPLLGTLVSIAVEDGHGKIEPHAIIDEAFAAVEGVQRLMSYHDPASELSRINREAAARSVPVSADTWKVLRAALRFSAASNGLFDVTVAPQLARLGFLPRHRDQPRACGHADWRDIELLPGRRVRLARRLRIDLGGIAKGYAVDRAVAVLRRHGVTRGSVNAGGDLYRLGPLPWTLHLRHPARPSVLLPVPADRPAAATSAGYFRGRRRGGHRIAPLINPRTHRPCTGDRSVTVLAADCLSADALTKIAWADPGRARSILPALNARAVVLEPGGDDTTGRRSDEDEHREYAHV